MSKTAANSDHMRLRALTERVCDQTLAGSLGAVTVQRVLARDTVCVSVKKKKVAVLRATPPFAVLEQCARDKATNNVHETKPRTNVHETRRVTACPTWVIVVARSQGRCGECTKSSRGVSQRRCF